MAKKEEEGLEQPLYTLDQLAQSLPKPDPASRAAIVEDHTREEFIAAGRRIASAKILIDEQRIYSAAYSFWQGASDAQKKTIVGFTPALLSVAVDEARKLAQMSGDAASKQQELGRAAAENAARADRSQTAGASLRDQAVGVLRGIAARDGTWLASIEKAHANADLATALLELAKVVDDILTSKGSVIAKRAALHGLDAAFAERLRAASADVRAVVQSHVGRTRHPPNQGALDLEDGINLHLLDTIVRAFASAHDIDSTIPRLITVATRNLIGRINHRTAPAPAPAPTPAQPTP
jgi:hypothetical protein